MASCTACGQPLPEAARYCPACGTERAPEAASQGERKLATILFADLVGSTTLADAEDPERVRRRLEGFYDAMSSEILAAGGTVEKFAGDAVMAVFGVPVAKEDHAERALHAALAMQRRMADEFGDQLALRIGVNSGDVVSGATREGSSFVSGDAVNVAARLEQAAGAGEILAGERTVAAVRGAFEFAAPQVIDAKGKPGGVACRRLERALSLMRPRGISGLRPAFVGRQPELDLLRATYGRVVAQGSPHMVTLMGETGVGKTRLVRELWAWLAGETPQPVQRTGRCLPYAQMTYWPLGEILKEHLGIFEGESPETASRKLGDRPILGLALGLDVAGNLHPLSAREQLQAAWLDFLGELAAQRPVVLLIEDLHWGEEPLLELCERVLRDLDGPVLMLGTARPELLDRRPAWGGGRRNTSLVWLEALTGEESTQLLSTLLASDLPEPLGSVLVERAEGNPLFVEELVGALIDEGVIEPRNGGWGLRELPEGFSVPDSVQAIVSARMDLLSPADKTALQAASVVGRVFWTGAVSTLAGRDGANWDLLEERDFVRRRMVSSLPGEIEYAFKHALTREVAYGSVPKARRARLHAACAEWLEREMHGSDETAAIVAHHYAEAVRPEDVDLAWPDDDPELQRLRGKAVTWLRRAAELAVRRYDIEDALVSLHRALELEEDDGARADLWREIGRANALKYDGEAFWSAMERSLELPADTPTRAEAYADLAYHTAGRYGMWKQAPDPDLLDSWIDRALELAQPESAARVKALLGRAFQGDKQDADVAREASTLAERLGDPELRANAWIARGFAASTAGDFDTALAFLERPFELLDELNDPELESEMWAHLATVLIARGEFSEAREKASRYDELSQRLTAHHRVHGVSALVELEELVGNWDAIAALETRVRASVDANLETPCARNPRSLLVCAAARMVEGDVTASRQLEERADALGMEGYPMLLDPPRMRLALLAGDLDEIRSRKLEAPAHHYVLFGLSYMQTRLDALVVLGDREAVEREAPALLRPRTYLEPFAQRALGIVRGDAGLIDEAQQRLVALGMVWHAEQTAVLRALSGHP